MTSVLLLHNGFLNVDQKLDHLLFHVVLVAVQLVRVHTCRTGKMLISETGKTLISETGKMLISETGKMLISETGKMLISDTGKTVN